MPWTKDTVSLVFSCTKGATALCTHILAARGQLDLDAPVAQYWPEFAQARKASIPVTMLLNHQAGLPAVRNSLPNRAFYEWDLMIKALAEEEPFWEPGTCNGYHGLTFGWLVGEVIRRVSGKSLGTFFRDEVAKPLGLDFWIGLPESLESRINRSARIDVDGSFTGFIKRILPERGINSREICRFKTQLTRFSACSVRMSVDLPETRAYQINTQIIDAMELWLSKDERQRVLWPAFVELSPRYFESLAKHAVPLDERAIAALANSPMALDVYAWLAQRLCRVGKPQFIPWSALKDQFGFGFGRMNNFKAALREVLSSVHQQYRSSRFELDGRGMTLHESPPPVRRVLTLCSG